MRQVLSTTDRSLAESLRFSLAAEGISAVTTNASVTALPAAPITVAVLDDRDYARAVAVLKGLQATPIPSGSGVRLTDRVLRLFLLVVLAIVAFLCINGLR